jgi:cytochrome c oxidase subunit 4
MAHAAETPSVRRRPIEHAHPGPGLYVRIAVILAVFTALEVAVYYMKSLASALVPILMALMLLKFTLVVGYFMHLKFDSRVFRRFFVTGLILAISVYTIVLVTFFVVIRPK